jgi:predicted  nucleic acid-binding Zn-ribbon protein
MYLGRRRRARTVEADGATPSPAPTTTLFSLKREFDEMRQRYEQLQATCQQLSNELHRLKSSITVVKHEVDNVRQRR